jgi:hypothetical protein
LSEQGNTPLGRVIRSRRKTLLISDLTLPK